MCLPFFHKYKIVNTHLGRGGDIGYPITCISYVCKKCGKTKIKMIYGHFTKEDLMASERGDKTC